MHVHEAITRTGQPGFRLQNMVTWSCRQYPRAWLKNVVVPRQVANRSTDGKLFDRQKTARRGKLAPSSNAKGLA